jgi:hypothetical protein
MTKKSRHKSLVALMLAVGLLLTTLAPSVLAQDRCRQRPRQVSRYEQDRYYDQRSYDDRYYDRRYDDRYDDRRYRRDEGSAVKRVGIGALIGAAGGALIGGKKGALIGAGAGAAGGYIYHRHKRGQRDDRYRR